MRTVFSHDTICDAYENLTTARKIAFDAYMAHARASRAYLKDTKDQALCEFMIATKDTAEKAQFNLTMSEDLVAQIRDHLKLVEVTRDG